MEINYQSVKNDCMQAVAKGQTVVRTEIDVQDRGGASKLLSVKVGAQVTSVEAVEGVAKVYGRVSYKILYLDGEGKISGLDYFGDFDVDARDDAVTVGATEATACVLDADCAIAGSTIRLEAVCEVNVYQIVTHQADVVTGAEGECLEEVMETVALSPIPESTIEVVEEIESHVGIDRVLLFDAKALHTATRMGVDSTTVEGKVYACVVYRAEGETHEKEIVFDFAEQLDVEGDLDLTVVTKQAKLVLTGEDDNNVMRVEVVLGVKGHRIVKETCAAVADVYVPEADVRILRDSFVCRRYEGNVSRTERIVAKAEGRETAANGEVVAAIAHNINLANVIAGEGQVTVEGLAVAGVLYRGEDGIMDANEVEMPFSTTFAAAGVTPECLLTGDVMPLGVNAARGDVEMDLLFAVKCYRPVAVRYTTAVEAQPIQEEEAVMSVYFAPREATVWDIARAVHVAPSELLKQNPALEEQAAGETRKVVVFRHRDLT